jgi:hypothetical protein
VHVPGRKDVNQEPDEGDEEGVNPAQPIHRKTKIRAEASDIQPGPQVIRNGCNARSDLSRQCTVVHESQVKRDDRRDADRQTRDRADKRFLTHTPTDEPVNGSPDQRRKDDVANHKQVTT